MNRQQIALLFVLAVSLATSIFYLPCYNPLTGDKEVYRYIGLLIHKGGVPYRDAFDHKPPLIYFLNYVGVMYNGWPQWLIDAGLALLATFFFFRLGRRYQLACPWVPPLLFNLMLRDNLLCFGMGMTREYTAIFMVLFFCVFMGKHRFRYPGLGVISALIFFMQQDQVLQLLPFLLFIFLPGNDTLAAHTRLLRVFLGFAVVALPLILYFALNNALTIAWQDAFLFNTGWYTHSLKASFLQHIVKLKTLMDQGNYEVAVLVTVTLGVTSLLLSTTNRKIIIIALLAVPLSVATEFMGGREAVPQIYRTTFSHYVLPLAASIPILLFCVFAFAREPALTGYKAHVIYGFLVCFSLTYTAIQHGTHLRKKNRVDGGDSSPELSYLRGQRPADYQFYVFGSTNLLYMANELNVRSPSPWIYQHFWQLSPSWDPDLRLLRSIEADLIRHGTTFVLDLTGTPNWFSNPREEAEWQGFLRDNYQLVMTNPALGSTLWKRKDKL